MLWLSSQQSLLTSGGAKKREVRIIANRKKKKNYPKDTFLFVLQQYKKPHNFLKAEQGKNGDSYLTDQPVVFKNSSHPYFNCIFLSGQ